jgi:hypothetical protein
MEKITCIECGKTSFLPEIVKKHFKDCVDPPTAICEKCSERPAVRSLYDGVLIFSFQSDPGNYERDH